LTFVVFAKKRVTMQFRAKNAPKTRDTAKGYLCVPPHIGDPVLRVDGRIDSQVTITSHQNFLA